MDQSLNGLNRPRSAALSQHMSQTSFGKFFQQSGSLDEQTVQQVWRAFGSYIAKELRNGRGVAIPRFGNFTFTSTIVDLAGTTNPGERDKQVREPVFIVGKDFVSAVYIKSGMAHNKGAQLRPFDNKGVCGIVPKVKINYTEVSTHCSLNKDICKSGCEQIFRFLSDKARKGESAAMEIPLVGTFIIRTGIAAVAFHEDLMEDTRGVTAKNHFVNKLFSSSVNKHNLQLQDNLMIRHNPSAGLGGAIKLTGEAENWLKSNLNINLNDIANFNTVEQIAPQSRRRLQSANPANRQQTGYNSVGQKSWEIKQQQSPDKVNINGILTEHNKHLFDQFSETKNNKGVRTTTAAGALAKRPMSAITRGSSFSRMSNVPEVARSRLLLIANDIYKVRQQLTEIAKSDPSGNLRETLSSSEIQTLLKKIGINIEIGILKALLKYFGFNWNGKSCSLMSLFNKCQEMIEGKDLAQQQNMYNTLLEKIGIKKPTVEDFVNKIKDLFYASKKTMFELFNEAKTGSGIDAHGLKKLVQKLSSNTVTDEQIEQAFSHAAKGVEALTYLEFDKAFSWPKYSGADWETKCFRAIRDWMLKNGLSSETAFELMLTKTNKIIQRKLNRVDFHQALQELDLKFSAPEVDSLFKVLDFNHDGELDLEEWLGRVYCDSANPLQMLREIIQDGKLTSDDLLFRMNLKLWDNPLDFPRFSECIRKLDPSLGDGQLRVLAKMLKNKDNKIEVSTLISNLCGKEFETIDYRNKIFKQIYQQIYPNNEQQFLKLMEESDPQNDGKVEAAALRLALAKITIGINQETIDRFVRFLDRDTQGKINYVGFLERMNEVSNRDHNPFKSVVQRLEFFITSNKQNVNSLLKRLIQKSGTSSSIGVPVDYFGEFLKSKIDKKRNQSELTKYAHYMDIDKDGFLSEIDIQTCIDNLQSDAFFKNCGEALATSTFSSSKKFYPIADALNPERALEIAQQIKNAMIASKIAYKEAFRRFDSNGDGFLSFTEFSQGVDQIMTLSLPVKEKFFAFMDKKKIGLVDYETFLNVIQAQSAKIIARNTFTDSFDWENQIIELIKQWILKERITIEEAFKCFDRDFDGFILKDDLKWALTTILKVKEEEIQQTRLDRLFKIMDFYKTNKIQLSDFQRLLNDQNPYATSGDRFLASTERFKSSFGGGFGMQSTFDWKLSAIQSIGLVISKKYASFRESFEDASNSSQKVTFEQFKRFVEKNNALNGFNLTLPLLQKLFAELDPHKKGYLTESDWNNSLSPFKMNDQTFIELKNLVQCSFTDWESAFQFFLSFKSSSEAKKKTISKHDFEKAVSSLSGNRFSSQDVTIQWKFLSEGGKYVTIDKYIFRSHFENIQYSGNSTVKEFKQLAPGARTTIVSMNSSNSQWEADIIEKLRQIVRSSSMTFEDIFKKFDEDGNGFISSIEFRNAIRKLNLGLSSREIDLIMKRVDTNGDGNIDWKEFISKFKTSELDERLKERAKDRMARLKELMILHMTSPVDAFRFFDESKLGKLTYQEFSRLVVKAHEVAGDRIPAYPVIKDLFDTIDIRKDGIIDLSEWQQTFGFVTEGNNKLSIKATPMSIWENTREYARIGFLIAKNRKLLKEQFEKLVSDSSSIVIYDQAKQILETFLHPHFNTLNDDKLRVVLKTGEVIGANEGGLGNRIDFMRMLNVYKSRHAAPQL